MQNSTPTVKAKTCRSINQQTKVLCQKMAFYIADSAVSRQPTLRFMSASAKCRLASEPHALPTVQCCHTALRNVVADYSSDMHTAQHLQHTNTFTVATGADIERRPTGDPPQYPVPFSDCSTIRLYWNTPYRKGGGSLSDIALRKD